MNIDEVDLKWLIQVNNKLEHLNSTLTRPLSLNTDRLAELIALFKSTCQGLNDQLAVLEKSSLVDFAKELKFLGARLDAIDKDIKEMKQEGIKKNIRVDVSCDGYELVKKSEAFKVEYTERDILKKCSKVLTERQMRAVVHYLGLYGEEKLTKSQIAKLLGITRERSSALINNALNKLQTHLRDAILNSDCLPLKEEVKAYEKRMDKG